MRSPVSRRTRLAFLFLAAVPISTFSHPLASSPTPSADSSTSPSASTSGRPASRSRLGEYVGYGVGIAGASVAWVTRRKNRDLRADKETLSKETKTLSASLEKIGEERDNIKVEKNRLVVANEELKLKNKELLQTNDGLDVDVKKQGRLLADAQQQIARLQRLAAGQQGTTASAAAPQQRDANAIKAQGDAAFEEVLKVMRSNLGFATCLLDKLQTNHLAFTRQGWLFSDGALLHWVNQCLHRAGLPRTSIAVTEDDFPDKYYDVSSVAVRAAWEEAFRQNGAQAAAPEQQQQQFRAIAGGQPITPPVPVSGRRETIELDATAAVRSRTGRSVADGLLAMWRNRKPVDVTRLATIAATPGAGAQARFSGATTRPGFPGVLQQIQGGVSGRAVAFRKPG